MHLSPIYLLRDRHGSTSGPAPTSTPPYGEFSDEQLLAERERLVRQREGLTLHAEHDAVDDRRDAVDDEIDRLTNELIRRARLRHPSSHGLAG